MSDQRQFFFVALDDVDDADDGQDDRGEPPKRHDEPAKDRDKNEEPAGHPADRFEDNEREALLKMVFNERVVLRLRQKRNDDQYLKIGENRHHIIITGLYRGNVLGAMLLIMVC